MANFSKILVANRGEIAVRIFQSANALGYRTVAVYSEADAEALHVMHADQAVLIGPAAVGESYLRGDKIIEAAKKTGADAIHPGYGFLAENPDFARTCGDAGITFIGPPPDAIAWMGNKRAAKERMLAAGVPCVPGFHGVNLKEEELFEKALAMKFPLMVKAAAGGGGRGMRLVFDKQEFPAAVKSARSEALGAFGNDELIIEKALIDPRHIEIQIFADSHGNVIHLGERDCSIQRRHQKVIEEAPSPAVNAELRQRMGEAAVAAARAVSYVGAGTVEFLLDEEGNFYFLEMNTRIQVEHPVTEIITGLDLVALQLRVAAGMPLGIEQSQVVLQGHAIEVRLYAEDTAGEFLPQTGDVLAWIPPAGEGVRVDHALIQGQKVSSHYDPMLAKIIAGGADREEARRRLSRAVEECVLFGVKSNQSFLAQVLVHEEFAKGTATTGFIGQYFQLSQRAERKPSDLHLGLAAILFHQTGAEQAQERVSLQNWQSSNPGPRPYKLSFDGREVNVLLYCADSERYLLRIGDRSLEVTLLRKNEREIVFTSGEVQEKAAWHMTKDHVYLNLAGEVHDFTDITLEPAVSGRKIAKGQLVAVMDGRIVAIHVEEGQKVEAGDTLMVMEAMKIEHHIRADIAGVVKPFLTKLNDQVKAQQLLVVVEAEASR
ncbi:MAG: acetyl-CoA carboxylase biotin carboxylase subunit [Geobacteraceae bacterium]